MTDKRRTPQTDEPDASPDRQAMPARIEVEQLPSVQNGISALASANAPIAYFDSVLFCGHYANVGQITLAAYRQISYGQDGVALGDYVVTGLLRAPLPSLFALREAINKIEKMALEQAARAAAAAETPTGMAH